MKQIGRIDPKLRSAASGSVRIGLIGAVLVFVAYTVTLWVANDLDLGTALAGGAANSAGVVLLGALAYRIIVTRLSGRGLAVQILGHLLLCAAFALLAYWLAIVFLGLMRGTSPVEFIVRAFPRRAMAWQLLENVTTYAIIAALAFRRTAGAVSGDIVPVEWAGGEMPPGRILSRYLVRIGEELRPIDVAAIVSISGADDYAEVATTDSRHLVRMTLNEFEQSLDPARFIRVHRSRIVNFDRIMRAEPAGGGRLLLHMDDGEAIAASRAGSRILRDRSL
jgi:two-component system LytT family response regulator